MITDLKEGIVPVRPIGQSQDRPSHHQRDRITSKPNDACLGLFKIETDIAGKFNRYRGRYIGIGGKRSNFWTQCEYISKICSALYGPDVSTDRFDLSVSL